MQRDDETWTFGGKKQTRLTTEEKESYQTVIQGGFRLGTVVNYVVTRYGN